MESLVTVLIVGFVLFVLWKAINPKWQFKVIVADNSITYSQGLPASSRGKVENFFLKDLRLSNRLVVTGRREHNGRLVLAIRGINDEGTKQRIRNFFTTNL